MVTTRALKGLLYHVLGGPCMYVTRAWTPWDLVLKVNSVSPGSADRAADNLLAAESHRKAGMLAAVGL